MLEKAMKIYTASVCINSSSNSISSIHDSEFSNTIITLYNRIKSN